MADKPIRRPRVIGYRKNGAPIWLAQGGDESETEQRSYTLEDLQGRTPDEIRDVIDVTKAQIRDLMYGNLGELRSRTETENKALAILVAVHKRAEEMYEEHRAIKEVLDRRPKAIEYLRLGKPDDAFADVRRLSISEARDAALRVLDDRNATRHLEADQRTYVERQVRRDTDIARRILVTETDSYRTAWQKLVTQPQPLLDEEERRAVQAFNEYRAASEGTTTAGGFGIPVKLAA